MGVWGVGSFDSDEALDVIDAVLEPEGDDPLREFIDRSTWNDKELSRYTATQMVAACEIVAALIGNPSPTLPEELAVWVEENKDYDVSSLIPLCKKAIEEMVAEGAPARDMWLREEKYLEWVKSVKGVGERLNS